MQGKFIGIMAAIVIAIAPAAAQADCVAVQDASQLKWIVEGNRAFLRNMNSFDPSWKGCCYSYWIDVSTDNGKAQFAVLLTSYASRLPLTICVSDRTVDGPIELLGRT